MFDINRRKNGQAIISVNFSDYGLMKTLNSGFILQKFYVMEDKSVVQGLPFTGWVSHIAASTL